MTSGDDSVKKKLDDDDVIKLKLVQASQAAKSITYSGYRDKPNKLLARVLAQGNFKTSLPDGIASKTGREANSTY